MDIFLILIICFLVFFMFRSYLRGTIICVLDTVALLISAIIATSFFDQFVYFLYSTSFYSGAKKSISGMMNFNMIMANNTGSTEIVDNTIMLPTVIADFIEKNNTPYVFSNMGVDNYDEFIVDVFMHLIIITLAFAIVFLAAFLVMYILRIMVMPYINVISFGKVDKVISVILGFVKGMLCIFIILALVPLLFTEFNYQNVFEVVCNSPTINYLYNINPILNGLLTGVNIR